MTKYIALTDNSVWLVESTETSMYVEDRATFGSPYIEDGRRFAGQVITGTITVGDRLHFTNVHENSYGEVGQPVATGVFRRIIAFEDLPKRQVPEGFIDITPGWTFLLPFFEGPTKVRDEAHRALGLADVLVALKDMGRITDDDIRAARQRVASA